MSVEHKTEIEKEISLKNLYAICKNEILLSCGTSFAASFGMTALALGGIPPIFIGGAFVGSAACAVWAATTLDGINDVARLLSASRSVAPQPR